MSEPPPLDPFELTYRELWPATVRLARLVSGSQDAAEDLAQDAFIGMMRAGSVESPRAYLRRSVINGAINGTRRKRLEREHLARQTEPVSPPPEYDETWQRLRVLPVRQRAVLVLRYYEDLSEAEIAEVLGCRPGTVKSTAARAIARLRKEMS